MSHFSNVWLKQYRCQFSESYLLVEVVVAVVGLVELVVVVVVVVVVAFSKLTHTHTCTHTKSFTQSGLPYNLIH